MLDEGKLCFGVFANFLYQINSHGILCIYKKRKFNSALEDCNSFNTKINLRSVYKCTWHG